jgi:hypothetical protein
MQHPNLSLAALHAVLTIILDRASTVNTPGLPGDAVNNG